MKTDDFEREYTDEDLLRALYHDVYLHLFLRFKLDRDDAKERARRAARAALREAKRSEDGAYL